MIIELWHLLLRDPYPYAIAISVRRTASLVRIPLRFFLATLKQMLNLNASLSYALKSSAVDLAWKVLIYDELGQDIISPLLTVKELRDLGVTLHVSVNQHQRIDHLSISFCLFDAVR